MKSAWPSARFQVMKLDVPVQKDPIKSFDRRSSKDVHLTRHSDPDSRSHPKNKECRGITVQQRSCVSHVSFCQTGVTSPDPRSHVSYSPLSGEPGPKAAAVPWSSSQSAAWRRAWRRAFRRARRHMSCSAPKISDVGIGLGRLQPHALALSACQQRLCSTLLVCPAATREAHAYVLQ